MPAGGVERSGPAISHPRSPVVCTVFDDVMRSEIVLNGAFAGRTSMTATECSAATRRRPHVQTPTCGAAVGKADSRKKAIRFFCGGRRSGPSLAGAGSGRSPIGHCVASASESQRHGSSSGHGWAGPATAVTFSSQQHSGSTPLPGGLKAEYTKHISPSHAPPPHDSRERTKRKDEILQGTKGRKASHQLSPVVANLAPCTADTS